MHSVRLPDRRRFRPAAPATVAVASLPWGFAGPAVPAQATPGNPSAEQNTQAITRSPVLPGLTADPNVGVAVSFDASKVTDMFRSDSSFTVIGPWA